MRQEKCSASQRVCMVPILAIVLCQLGVGAPAGKSVYDDLRRGRSLTSEEAVALEEKLEKDLHDVTSRTQLLGYYGGSRSFRDESAKAVKRKHVLWFIRNAPGSEVLGKPEARIDHILDSEGYAEAKKAWMSQIDREPENAALLGNASGFFTFGDRRTAIKLLQRAQTIDPSNPQWPENLGRIFSMGARGPGEDDMGLSEKALEQLEKAYELGDETRKDALLESLAKAAFSADRLDKARQYADLMLQNTEAGWNYGNRVHHGNLVLGRIALREGNVEEAKSRLITAGNTPGSPQLNSFGPNMALAKALLEIGEREVVLEYFELCSKFWNTDRARDKLDKWGVLAAAGRIPDFRANLVY